MKKLFVFLPCYNEEENIGLLIENWLEQKEKLHDMGFKLIITGIDDKSTDNTKKIIQQYSEKFNCVYLFAHKYNKNLGGGVRTAFELFVRNAQKGDVCVLMDGDNTHDPKYCCEMLDKIKSGKDCVIASRYQHGAKVVGVPKIRVFLSNSAMVIYKIILGVKNVNDYTCGYRAYTYEIIKRANEVYGKDFIKARNFSCMMEVLYKLHCVGAAFDEVPFVLRYDQKMGASKIKVLQTVFDSLYLAIKLRLTLKTIRGEKVE